LYACITGLPRPGFYKKIKITSEDDITKLEQCTPENPVTLTDKHGNEVQFVQCRIRPLKDGTRIIETARYRAEQLLGKTGKKNGRKFTVKQLPKVAKRTIQKADYAAKFPDAQSQELVEFADTNEQVYLDVLNDKDVHMDATIITEYTYTHNPAAGPVACIVYGGQSYSVFDIFVNKDGGRRDGVTTYTADDSIELSRDVQLLRVQEGTPTKQEIARIKTVYGLSADLVYDSTLVAGDILSLIFKITEKQAASAEQPAKKARTNTNASFIDRTLSLLKL
jgi:hypothetical protein